MTSETSQPRHLAISPDGSGRWATGRGLPRTVGHEAGGAAFLPFFRDVVAEGIEYLSIHVFSTENWRRTDDEVGGLLRVAADALATELAQLNALGVRILWVGKRDRVPPETRAALDRVEAATEGNQNLTVAYCVDYGSRDDLRQAAERAAHDVAAGVLAPAAVYDAFDSYFYAPELPDVDLYIRTSGEQRLSNFMLWHISYAELYFTEVLWPDFSASSLRAAIEHYGRRTRRMGTGQYDQTAIQTAMMDSR